MQTFDGIVLLEIVVIEVLLKLVVRKFVAILKLAVAVIFDLNGIVGEVDKLIFEIFQIKYLGACANIAFFVPEKFGNSLDAQQKHISSDIKLSLLIEKNVG